MPESLIDLRFYPLSLFLLLSLAFLLQLIYYWVIFWRLGRYRKKNIVGDSKGISVVICARNEHEHLKENLPLILEQNYPEFEVLVVNHASDDDTDFLLARMEAQYPKLKTIAIKEDLNFFSGKKFPLSIGIKSARYDRVLLTDADCCPASKDWISSMQSGYTDDKEIILGYGPYKREQGCLNKLIRFDTAHIAIQYLSYALAGLPYMGVGRNLSYAKEVFYRNNGFISHYMIRSGDDDLFINRVANRKNTAIIVNPESYTFSDSKQTFGKWITQKKRHFSTSHHYKTRHKFLLALYSGSLWLFYCLMVLLLALQWNWIPVLGIFIIRLFTQYLVLSKCLKKLDEKDLVPFLPVYEVMLLLFNSGIMISNVFRKSPQWK